MIAAATASGMEHHQAAERQMLMSELLEAVKRCQVRFGGRAELATESDPCVALLCHRMEAALSHGLRSRAISKSSSAFRHMTEIVSTSLHIGRGGAQDQLVLWHYIREHLTRHEYERYTALHNVTTDVGRGRAWLRAALNERSLERYLHMLLSSQQLLQAFYEDWALLLDQEMSSTLPTMAAGLGSILFAISIDNSDLNGGTATTDTESVGTPLSRSEPVIPPVTICVSDTESKKKKDQRRRKRVPAQIVNFDDDPSESETAGSPADSEFSATPKLSIETTGTEERQQNFSRVEQPAEEVGVDAAADSLSACSRPYDLSLPSSAGRRRGSPPRRHTTQTLTPVNNVSVGELIPVSQGVGDEPHSEDDSLSVPSYSEDTDRAAAALLATQKLLQSNLVDMSPHELTSVRNTQDSQGRYQVNGEVREALFTVLALKEELQAESRSLKKLVEQMQETNTHLQAEMSEKQRQHTEKTERLEARIQALARENELLKHQLRKYVGAVQMLKRDGMQAYEALASLEGQQSRPIDPADYHHEAQEYEKKLIQVAEMHGELMEFNDRLHRQLQSKEAALRRLREELVDLRGPLPDDGAHTSDEDAASITSDYDVSSLGAAARALVNIWIPSAFLTGGSSDVHHVYQVFVRIRDDEWNIYRRYAQFYSLHKQLKKQDAVFTTFDFPPKKTLGNKDSRFVEERRRRLQHYLRCVVNHIVQTNNEMATSPDKDLLVSLVPFFGDTFAAPEDRNSSHKKGTSSCSRSLFSRLGRSTETRAAENTPQYTGL